MALHYHNALIAEGVTVLSLGHPEGVLAEELAGHGFLPLHARTNHDPLAAYHLRGYAQSFQPDLVLAHGNRATGLCTLPFMRLREKTVQVMHNQFSKGHLRQVRAAICVSASVLDHVRKTFPDVMAVEVQNFAPLRVQAVRTAKADVPVLGALGRMHAQKGFDILIAAAALMRDQGVVFHLKLAGDGPDAPALQAQVTRLSLSGHVTFCGWQASPGDFLSGLDLFILPSRYEPFGLVVIEAMAAGVPVLATDLEGPKQILDAGRYGRLFEGENPQALAQTLKQACLDIPALRTEAHRAQRYAVENYGFDAGRFRLHQALRLIASSQVNQALATTS